MTSLAPDVAPAVMLNEHGGLALAVVVNGGILVFFAPIPQRTSWCALGGVVTFTALVAITVAEALADP